MTPEMVEAGWVAEAHGVVAVNRAATLHYGYSRDELLSMTVDDLCAEETHVTEAAQTPRTPSAIGSPEPGNDARW